MTSNLVVKSFTVEESIGLLFETTAYSKLFALQSNTIPFCYGVWDIEDPQSKALLFERIIAPTIAEPLDCPDLALREIYALFTLVVQAVEKLHASGYCHRDLNPQNILVRDRHNQPQQVVLINLEATRYVTKNLERLTTTDGFGRPVDEGGILFDKASISRAFRAAGVDLEDLRNWWSKLEGTQ